MKNCIKMLFWQRKQPDDLEEILFENEETRNAPASEKPTVSAVTKRRNWLRKHVPQVAADEDEVQRSRANSMSSNVSSRRESAASAQGSPVRSSPKKSKESKNKSVPAQDEVLRRPRKDRDVRDSPGNESRLSAGARLYRVMEEQFLGEAVEDTFENLYIESGRRISICTTLSMKSNNRYRTNDVNNDTGTREARTMFGRVRGVASWDIRKLFISCKYFFGQVTCHPGSFQTNCFTEQKFIRETLEHETFHTLSILTKQNENSGRSSSSQCFCDILGALVFMSFRCFLASQTLHVDLERNSAMLTAFLIMILRALRCFMLFTRLPQTEYGKRCMYFSARVIRYELVKMGEYSCN